MLLSVRLYICVRHRVQLLQFSPFIACVYPIDATYIYVWQFYVYVIINNHKLLSVVHAPNTLNTPNQYQIHDKNFPFMKFRNFSRFYLLLVILIHVRPWWRVLSWKHFRIPAFTHRSKYGNVSQIENWIYSDCTSNWIISFQPALYLWAEAPTPIKDVLIENEPKTEIG